jgi:hypothetical protein
VTDGLEQPQALVVDTTALMALGRGNQSMSRFVTLANRTDRLRLYTPALCLTAAVAAQAELAEHVDGLLAIEVVDLTFAGAGSAGRLIAAGVDWRHAQAVVAAMPSAEWPNGLPVATAVPDTYVKHHVRTIDVR